MKKTLCATALAALFALSGCTRKGTNPDLEVNVYTGVPGVARLGETETVLLKNTTNLSQKKYPLEDNHPLRKAGITHYYDFRDVGLKVYIQRNTVALIEIQDPFKGSIQSKRLAIFLLAPPPNSNWEDALVREFGEPRKKAAGGRLSSDSLFYGWGDIAFNRQGPNEMALYRDPLIGEYRQGNFGRDLRLFTP